MLSGALQGTCSKNPQLTPSLVLFFNLILDFIRMALENISERLLSIPFDYLPWPYQIIKPGYRDNK